MPFIVTLGTMLLVRGAAKGLAEERRVEAPLTWLNDLLRTARGGTGFGVPAGIWLVAAAGADRRRRAAATRGSAATSSRSARTSARRGCAACAIERTQGAGLHAGRGASPAWPACLQFSRLSVGDPTVAVGLELDVIAAVIIGGGSLLGGRGTVVGTMVGAAIMTVIQIGCSQHGLPNWVQQIVTGGIIVLAVALDRRQARSEQAS